MNQDIVKLSTQVTELLRRHRTLKQEYATLQQRYIRLQGKYEQKGIKISAMQKQLAATNAAVALSGGEDKTVLKQYLAELLDQIDLNIKLLS